MSKKNYLIALLVVWVFFQAFIAACPAKIFFWTDAKGVKHFSNTSAPEGMSVQQYHEQTSHSPEHPKRNAALFQVVKVYDGDTILVKKDDMIFPVRLVAIDAPEIRHGKQQESQPYGQKAKKYLTGLTKGEKVALVSYGLGGFNRILAEVFTGSTNLNLKMIQAGLAEVYQGKKPVNLNCEPYYHAQRHAKKIQKGMWAQGRKYVSPKTWRRKYPLHNTSPNQDD